MSEATTPNPEQSERLLALAERCESADPAAPNIDLHMEILRAMGWTSRGAELIDPQGQRCMQTPDPLHSIDGAVALVPDGHEWLRWGPGTMIVMLPPQPGDDEKAWARHIECRGATPALALCAAALRARSAPLVEAEG